MSGWREWDPAPEWDGIPAVTSVADLEWNGDDVRGDAIRLQVDRVDATVAVRIGDDGRRVVVDPVVVLVGSNCNSKYGVDVATEAPGSHDPGIPDLVRLLVREAGQVEEVGQVLGVPGPDRSGREEHDQAWELLVDTRCEGAGKGGLILVGRRGIVGSGSAKC